MCKANKLPEGRIKIIGIYLVVLCPVDLPELNILKLPSYHRQDKYVHKYFYFNPATQSSEPFLFAS